MLIGGYISREKWLISSNDDGLSNPHPQPRLEKYYAYYRVLHKQVDLHCTHWKKDTRLNCWMFSDIFNLSSQGITRIFYSVHLIFSVDEKTFAK